MSYADVCRSTLLSYLFFPVEFRELSLRLHKIICVDKVSGKGLLKATEILVSSCLEVTHT